MKHLLLALMCLLPTLVYAGEAKDLADDPVMERRMINLAEKVRCLVCQSENVASSRSDWSNDVRQIMRDKMKAGATDQEIMDILVERFGKSVLFDPPVDKETMPLWLAPFIFVNPVTYAVDGIRGALLGTYQFSLLFDFALIIIFALVMILLGTYAFKKMKI